jgi:hypothetical protein
MGIYYSAYIFHSIGLFRGIVLNIVVILVALQSRQRATSLHVPNMWMVVSISSQFRNFFMFDILIVLRRKFVAIMSWMILYHVAFLFSVMGTRCTILHVNSQSFVDCNLSILMTGVVCSMSN